MKNKKESQEKPSAFRCSPRVFEELKLKNYQRDICWCDGRWERLERCVQFGLDNNATFQLKLEFAVEWLGAEVVDAEFFGTIADGKTFGELTSDNEWRHGYYERIDALVALAKEAYNGKKGAVYFKKYAQPEPQQPPPEPEPQEQQVGVPDEVVYEKSGDAYMPEPRYLEEEEPIEDVI